MKIGLQIARFDWPGGPTTLGSTLSRIARSADQNGFDSLWVMDHFFQIEPTLGTVRDPMLEAYSTLNFMAGVTDRCQLGTLVTGVTYREPAVLVKAVTTLDVLSGGRAALGIGAAWYEREAAGLGLSLPPVTRRFEQLEETLQIALKMWAGDTSPYEGEHYQLPEPIHSPGPLSRPHPPILIGGAGEQKTLRLVAQYADACNLFAFIGEKELVHKLDVLKRHCDEVGRDYDEIERTVLAPVDAAVDASNAHTLVDTCRSLAALGFQHVIFSSISNLHEIEPLEVIGRDVVPAIREL